MRKYDIQIRLFEMLLSVDERLEDLRIRRIILRIKIEASKHYSWIDDKMSIKVNEVLNKRVNE